MTEKRGKRRVWNILLAVHALLYLVAWAAALYQLITLNFAFDNSANTTRLITAVLLWMPILALHVGVYLYARRWATPNDERKAFREGYAEALRQFADQTYTEHKSVPDESDLVDMPEKRKRSS